MYIKGCILGKHILELTIVFSIDCINLAGFEEYWYRIVLILCLKVSNIGSNLPWIESKILVSPITRNLFTACIDILNFATGLETEVVHVISLYKLLNVT